MSAALRIVESLNRGEGLPDHDGTVAFVAKLLAPVYNPGGRCHTIHAKRTK